MMGYAALSQTDTGLHMRQRARAFIVADAANPTDRVLFVNLGAQHSHSAYSTSHHA